MKHSKHLLIIFISLLTLTFAHPVTAAAARDDAPHVYHILCICSYSLAYTTVPDMIEGLTDGLSGISSSVDYEFMDAKNFYKPEDVSAFYDFISYKLKDGPAYDLLIVCDDNAMRFWTNYHNDLFPDLPMIFLGVNNISDAQAAADLPNVTGIAEVPDVLGTLEVMHDLFPDRKKVVALVDGSITGRGEYALFQDVSSQYDEFTYQWILTDDYSTKGLAEAISRIPSDAMILYLDFMQDADGVSYSEQAASRLLYENAKNIPIFRTTFPNLGNGVLGGKMYSLYTAGKTAGETAAQVLSGEKNISEIPIVTDSAAEYMFDQNIMDEYNIHPSDLPMNATIINPHRTLISFYKENPLLSNLIIIVIVILIGITVILILLNHQRERIINTDFLTQIPNRHYIQARLSAAIARRAPFGILMMDVDHFKTINDTLGHAIGDELLAGVAERLRELSSSQVLFARIGGDEFMALITGKTLAHADEFCAEVVERVTEVYVLSSGTLHITTSVGLAAYPEHCPEPSELNAYADSALYYVKEHGRNGYQIYDSRCSAVLGDK